jgi:hypothetical protein
MTAAPHAAGAGGKNTPHVRLWGLSGHPSAIADQSRFMSTHPGFHLAGVREPFRELLAQFEAQVWSRTAASFGGEQAPLAIGGVG